MCVKGRMSWSIDEQIASKVAHRARHMKRQRSTCAKIVRRRSNILAWSALKLSVAAWTLLLILQRSRWKGFALWSYLIGSSCCPSASIAHFAAAPDSLRGASSRREDGVVQSSDAKTRFHLLESRKTSCFFGGLCNLKPTTCGQSPEEYLLVQRSLVFCF